MNFLCLLSASALCGNECGDGSRTEPSLQANSAILACAVEKRQTGGIQQLAIARNNLEFPFPVRPLIAVADASSKLDTQQSFLAGQPSERL
jgi:hypothetical protein